MSSSIPNIEAITRFSITRRQYVIAIGALLALAAIGLSTITQSQTAIKQAKVLSDVETPAASIIFTQRETLVYATRLAQWVNGGTTRREVQIARNLLAQRLAVIDASGRSMGSRASNKYWSALKASDQIVASTVPGILPESMHEEVDNKIEPLIDEILASARQLVVSYQRSVDQEMADDAQRIANGNRLQLLFFYLFIFLSGLFLVLNVRTNFKNYRLARQVIESEQSRLDRTLHDLRQAQIEVSKLQDLDQSKNEFIATINHELRTPLTSIIGYIDVIREEMQEAASHKFDSYLDVLDRNAQILLNLVESILSLSTIDASQGQLSESDVDLIDVIDGAIFVLQPNAEVAHIEIGFDYDRSGKYLVRGDRGQLSQIFLNLIGNAIKFSPDHSQIEVSLIATDGLIRISIKDHGIGIPQEDQEKLFQRFFRAKNAVVEQFQGTGLGLSIVSQALTLHHGTIAVDSQVGVGTTITVTLPTAATRKSDQLIAARAEDVLTRAIARLTDATPADAVDLLHELGGAISFYDCQAEGELLLNHSRTLASQEKLDEKDAQSRLETRKRALISKLESLKERK